MSDKMDQALLKAAVGLLRRAERQLLARHEMEDVLAYLRSELPGVGGVSVAPAGPAGRLSKRALPHLLVVLLCLAQRALPNLLVVLLCWCYVEQQRVGRGVREGGTHATCLHAGASLPAPASDWPHGV